MRISITTPFGGKSFCFYEYANTVKTIVKSNPDIQWVFSVLDNSNSESFKQRIYDLKNELNIEFYYHKETCDYIHNIGLTVQLDRLTQVRHLYNKLIFEVMPQDVDYCFVIEDDISFDDVDAVKKCLDVMIDPKVATVTANTLDRRFGLPQPAVYDSTGELKKIPLELSGTKQVIMSAMGFWFTRFSILKDLRLPESVNGMPCADLLWCFNCLNYGYKIFSEQSIHCKHHYKLSNGIVDYVSPTHNTIKNVLICG